MRAITIEDFSAAPEVVPITRTYALAEAPQAIADFGAGAIGKLAVTLI